MVEGVSVDRNSPDTRPRKSPAIVAVIAESEVTRRRAVAAVALRGHATAAVYPTADAFLVGERGEIDALVLCCERLSGKEVALLRRLKRRLSTVPVVVAATSVRRSALADGLAAGMDGCVLAPDIDECLGLAVESARRGQVSLPRELSGSASRPTLSVREKQTLALVVMGFSNAEIAKRLFVSESTVKSHLSSAFDRLGVRSRSEATTAILDPETGFGTGILAISGDERRRPRSPA